jgi:hypothetical protein
MYRRWIAAAAATMMLLSSTASAALARGDESFLYSPQFASADFQVIVDECTVVDASVRAIQGTLLKSGLPGAPTYWSDVTVYLWVHNPDPDACTTEELELTGWAPGQWTFDRFEHASVTEFEVRIADRTGALNATAVINLDWSATLRERTTFVNHIVDAMWFESINVVPADVSGSLVFTSGGGVVADGFAMTGENASFAELGQSRAIAIVGP